MVASSHAPVELGQLDLGYLALFFGMAMNDRVEAALHAQGFTSIRQSHGYVFQHLLAGPRSVTELGRLLGVSQQAASKSVRELALLGYVEDVPSSDARARQIVLSPRGHQAVAVARSIRARLDKALQRRYGADVGRAKELLASALSDLGGAAAVRTRRVRAPR